MHQEQMASTKELDDEIDLFELAQSLWQEKVTILVIGFVTTLLAAVYAFQATPVYQVSTVLKPVSLKSLDELNSTGVYSLTPDEALERVGAALESYDVQLAFFNKHPEFFEKLLDSERDPNQAFESFSSKALSVKKPDAKKDQGFTRFVGLQVDYAKGMNGPDIANGLVGFAIESELERIKSDLQVLVANRLEKIERELTVLRAGYQAEKEIQIVKLQESDGLKRLKLEDELEAIRQSLQTKRENRLKQLDEAIIIAESLGIKKPATPASLSTAAGRISGSVIHTEVNNQQLPLYFMGTDALLAEKAVLNAREGDDFTSNRIVEIQQELKLLNSNRQIEILQNRENEDLFLAELADKKRQTTRLANLNLDLQDTKLVEVDKKAIAPMSAVKPKKQLIIAVGFVLGGMLGVFAALLRSAIRKRKAVHA